MAEPESAQVRSYQFIRKATNNCTKAKKERKTWDKEEWREKAKQKDAEDREMAKQNEELMRKGMRPHI